MDSEFSEFSYAFAATSELADQLRSLNAAPVFPSLIAEARLGWDVKLQTRPGAVVFLQFKTPEALTMASALEWPLYRNEYFRIYIRRLRHSRQHNLLKSLANRERFVYYLAPRFYRISPFNRAYVSRTVIAESVSFPLQLLPVLRDDGQHYICYRTGADARWCSEEPQQIKAFPGQHLPGEIVKAIQPGQSPITLERLVNIRSGLLELSGRSALTQDMNLARPNFVRIAHDIEYLSRTFLSAETLFVTTADGQN
jgi:hypothetical protein